MTLKPLLDKVVLKQVEAVETTKAGILLPGSAQEKPQVSEVVAVGPGGMVDGNQVVMTLKVGEKVITTSLPSTIPPGPTATITETCGFSCAEPGRIMPAFVVSAASSFLSTTLSSKGLSVIFNVPPKLILALI